MTDKQIEVVKEKPSDMQIVAHDMAERLKYMIVNGNKLQDKEIYALAQYAATTGLDPFSGECWYFPDKGPTPGIAGWRRKGQEQLEYEAQNAKLAGAYIWYEYKKAEPGSCNFEPTKDIAYQVILHDSVSEKLWHQTLSNLIATLNGSAMRQPGDPIESYLKIVEMARSMMTPLPTWDSYGVVFGTENFGAVEKYDRHERAKKRGEKGALKKRFPRLRLPEPVGFDNDVIDTSDFKVVMQEPERLQNGRTTEQNIYDLGFSEKPKEIEQSCAMSYEQAFDTLSSSKQKYGTMTNKDLEGRKIGIEKKMRENLTVDQQNECQNKLEAIKILLAVPEGDRLKSTGQETLL